MKGTNIKRGLEFFSILRLNHSTQLDIDYRVYQHQYIDFIKKGSEQQPEVKEAQNSKIMNHGRLFIILHFVTKTELHKYFTAINFVKSVI